MKTLLDIVKLASHITDSTHQYFLIGVDVASVNEDRLFPELHNGQNIEQFTAAKTGKGLSQITKDLGYIVLVQAEAGHIIEETTDLAEIRKGSIVKVLNGHLLIQRYGDHCNLEGTNLRGAQLEGANLEQANLTDADLAGANLKNANLKGSNLRQTELYGANLHRCNLQRAVLDCTDLRRANLTEADLRYARLDKVALRGAELWSAYLWDIDLSTCFVGGTDVFRADSRGAKITVS